MYCRKCGNKLSDDDAFCRKCGAKVFNDSTDNERRLALFIKEKFQQMAVDAPDFTSILKRTLIYTVIFLTITVIVFNSYPLPTDNRNLLLVRFIFGVLLFFPFFLPLLIGIFIIKRSFYLIEFLFVFMLMLEIEAFIFGDLFFSLLTAFVALVIGITLLFLIAGSKFLNR